MKGYTMIARIIMSEHPNEQDLEHFTSDHKEAVKVQTVIDMIDKKI